MIDWLCLLSNSGLNVLNIPEIKELNYASQQIEVLGGTMQLTPRYFGGSAPICVISLIGKW